MSRYIEWTDDRGRHHILDTVPIDFGPVERIPVHKFEPRLYLDGDKQIVSETCWCGAEKDRLIHE